MAGALNSGVWIFSACPDTETALHRTHSVRESEAKDWRWSCFTCDRNIFGGVSLFCRRLIALARPDEVIMNYSWKRDACSPQLIFRKKSVFYYTPLRALFAHFERAPSSQLIIQNYYIWVSLAVDKQVEIPRHDFVDLAIKFASCDTTKNNLTVQISETAFCLHSTKSHGRLILVKAAIQIVDRAGF